MKIGKQKNIALIAHDNRKKDLVEWVRRRKDILSGHFLCGTGTTAALISKETGLPVRPYKSGPLGGSADRGLYSRRKSGFYGLFLGSVDCSAP